MDAVKDLNVLSHFVKYGLVDELEQYMESIDLEEIGNTLLNEYSSNELKDLLQEYISILNFIENETPISTPVSDDLYDKIVAKYTDLGGTKSIGVQAEISSNKKFGHHKYPELRGSLDKIHFLKNCEIPEKDSRKSFEYFLSGVIRELKSQGKSMPKNVQVMVDFKWDGTSHVLEFLKNLSLNRVLTRYDVDSNIGVDITHIFRGCNDISSLLFTPLPENAHTVSFGLKVETFMPTEYFNQYVKDTNDSKCNRRSAITSIVNKGEDEAEPGLLKYLALKPLQISSDEKFELTDKDEDWFYIGYFYGHYQYISIYTSKLGFKVPDLETFLNGIDSFPLKTAIDAVKLTASDIVPIDGAVITLLNQDIIDAMGRSDNKNKFQIAFKFPQGVKKTKLKEVKFQVGPTAGTITPLAIVEPVVINGNTITNATLSNFDKMERLDLNIGDEVIIKYDIIPKLEKDKTCQKGTGIKIIRPTVCPICKSDLNGGNRCLNPDCDAKLAGRIYNYIRKMKIKSFGKKTIEKFVDCGILTCIGDLYRLPKFQDKIIKMPDFGMKSFMGLVSSVFNKTKVYPHELLGSLGIPDISIATMKKVCENMSGLLSMNEKQLIASIPEMIDIPGIGEITAKKIVYGIIDRLDTIEDLLKYMEFIEYPKEKKEPDEVVLFTEFRDENFAEYLESINVRVATSYVKALTILIVPDGIDINASTNKKVIKAKEQNIPILTNTEAKKRFGYS